MSVLPLDFSKLNRLPKGQIVAKGRDLYIGRKKVLLYGANQTYTSCFPADPAALVDQWVREGLNWIRLHHIDRLVFSNPGGYIPKVLNLMDLCYAAGIRVSIDLIDEAGADVMGGVDALKVDVYKPNSKGRTHMETYMKQMAPVLKHPALFLVCLVNEAAHLLVGLANGADMAADLYKWAAPKLRDLGFTGFITDLPDGIIKPPMFGPVAKNYDVTVCHFYGDHPQADTYNPNNSWPFDGYNSNTALWYMKWAGNPALMQEMGDLFPKPYRCVNTVFQTCELLHNGIAGLCHFARQTNLGTSWSKVDQFAYLSDLARLVGVQFGAVAFAYAGKTASYAPAPYYKFGYAETPNRQSKNYDFSMGMVSVSIRDKQGWASVRTSATKALVFRLDETVVRGFESVDQGTVRKVTNWGTSAQTSFPSSAAPLSFIGYDVVANRFLNPVSGEVSAEILDGYPDLRKSSTIAITAPSVGVYAVTLRKVA